MDYFKRNKTIRNNKICGEISPDEIFLDSSNLPEFNSQQMEGRIERAISQKTLIFLGVFFLFVIGFYVFYLWNLQINDGETYAERSEKNRLQNDLIFSERGLVFDRRNIPLIWNDRVSEESDFSLRKYIDLSGFSHLLGFVKYPQKDKSGFYFQKQIDGMDGIEKVYENQLAGSNGLKITEVDALGKLRSESVLEPPKNGDNLILTIDARIQNKLFEFISGLAHTIGFTGGAGVIMDVNTGEIISLVSYPEYNSNIMVDGSNKKMINSYLTDKNNPFLDRVISGLYTPGSIVKPIVALGVLNEKIISPTKQILSTGSISIPNPYDPAHPTVFKDWQAQGWVDMRKALAFSSDVYFYEVGGGFGDQIGLGIDNIKKYMNLFGFGKDVNGDFFKSQVGTIPDPEWKKENFSGEDWRIGDTYHTAIGQYGFQVTPIQVVRAIGAVANGGKLLDPQIILADNSASTTPTFLDVGLPKSYFDVVRGGMRDSVLEGTSKGLNVAEVNIGAKTGTAQLGTLKQYVNSWVVGFFPYENPKYAFAVLMEKGPQTNTIGALYVMRQLVDWMAVSTPEYLK